MGGSGGGGRQQSQRWQQSQFEISEFYTLYIGKFFPSSILTLCIAKVEGVELQELAKIRMGVTRKERVNGSSSSIECDGTAIGAKLFYNHFVKVYFISLLLNTDYLLCKHVPFDLYALPIPKGGR